MMLRNPKQTDGLKGLKGAMKLKTSALGMLSCCEYLSSNSHMIGFSNIPIGYYDPEIPLRMK